jgi:6-phosphofructokinase
MLKGNLMVGQSGGPTPVINASLAGVILEAGRYPAITGIYGMVHGIEGALKEELINLGQESPETIDLLAQTPASALGSCRHKLGEGEYERILEVFQAHSVRHFVYIGGNDSMDTTDHCPGYGSAGRFFALAARDTGRDLEAMATFDDVTILEAMGRNAGWLTAASALGRETEDEAPHLVYVPEIPFENDRFLDDVKRIHGRLGRVFVVVCEGIKDSEGRPVGAHQLKAGGSDAFGHVLHTLTTGVAAYLADLVKEKLTIQARFLRPVLIGRAMSACVAETDRQEALRAGRDAVAHLAAGQNGLMVTLERVSEAPYVCGTGVVPLAEVANAEKLLPREFLNEAGNMVTQAFKDYAMPLVDGPLPPLARLKGVRLPQKVS